MLQPTYEQALDDSLRPALDARKLPNRDATAIWPYMRMAVDALSGLAQAQRNEEGMKDYEAMLRGVARETQQPLQVVREVFNSVPQTPPPGPSPSDPTTGAEAAERRLSLEILRANLDATRQLQGIVSGAHQGHAIRDQAIRDEFEANRQALQNIRADVLSGTVEVLRRQQAETPVPPTVIHQYQVNQQQNVDARQVHHTLAQDNRQVHHTLMQDNRQFTEYRPQLLQYMTNLGVDMSDNRINLTQQNVTQIKAAMQSTTNFEVNNMVELISNILNDNRTVNIVGGGDPSSSSGGGGGDNRGTPPSMPRPPLEGQLTLAPVGLNAPMVRALTRSPSRSRQRVPPMAPNNESIVTWSATPESSHAASSSSTAPPRPALPPPRPALPPPEVTPVTTIAIPTTKRADESDGPKTKRPRG